MAKIIIELEDFETNGRPMVKMVAKPTVSDLLMALNNGHTLTSAEQMLLIFQQAALEESKKNRTNGSTIITLPKIMYPN